jgi:hypothetical protein
MNLPTSPARPTGVTILAILAALGGIIALGFGLCATIIGGIGGGLLAAAGAGGAGLFVGFIGILSGLFVLVNGVLDLAFAYGAWFLKPWGWMLGVIAGGFGLLSELIRLINHGGFFAFLIGAAISGAILYYLFTPEVKHAFGRQ